LKSFFCPETKTLLASSKSDDEELQTDFRGSNLHILSVITLSEHPESERKSSSQEAHPLRQGHEWFKCYLTSEHETSYIHQL
jgi:hypothetical protein